MGVPQTITDHELAANLKQTAGWEKRRDLPDLVALQDVREELELSVAEMRARLRGHGPLPVEAFPFPNPPKRPRRFCTADPLDEIVLRTAAGRIALRVDELLGDARGVHVFSSRLEKRPPGWTYRHHARLQRARRALGRRWIEDSDFPGLGITDVASYYPSIDPVRLAGLLLGFGGDAHATSVLERWLTCWRSMGHGGLPIGVEASGLLGTAYLIPADQALAALGLEIIRVTDDYWVRTDEAAWEVAVGAFDGVLAGLGLTRNVEKTEFLAAPEKARRLVRELASAELLAPPSGQDLEALRDRLEEAIAAHPIDGQSLRFATGGLCRVGDRFMIEVFAKDPALIKHAPRRLGDCLCHEDRVRDRSVTEFFDVLEEDATPETEAVHASILRGAARCELGRPEGELFANIAFDPGRPQYTRGWALEALARTPAWSPESAFGLALTEGRPCLQRAATLSFRSHVGNRTNLAAVTEIRRDVPSLAPTSSWVQRFAA